MSPEHLDAWLPDPAIRTHHRRRARADPARLWNSARAVHVDDTRALGRLVRWSIPDLPVDETFHGMLARYPFTPLDGGERHLVAGLCGRIWTRDRDYPRIDGPEDFLAWDRPGTVRVLIAHWVEQREDATSELVSEARVAPVDRRAVARLRTLWALVGPFERLIGAEGLTAAVRGAEDR